jgi:hypothetical protein
MRAMAKEEIASGKGKLERLELGLKKALLPKDPNDSRNIIRCKGLSNTIHNFCVGKITKLGKQFPKPVTVMQVCIYTRPQNVRRN